MDSAMLPLGTSSHRERDADDGDLLTDGWLRGTHLRLLVAGMAALAVLALVYPDSRKREISDAAEAIHRCEREADAPAPDGQTRRLARQACQQLRAQYTARFGHEL